MLSMISSFASTTFTKPTGTPITSDGVNYVKGQVGKVIPQPDGTLMVQASDLLEKKQIKP